jgi:lysophospholipase L1-like esterase
LGSGYVAYTQALFEAFHPTVRVRVINRGISGNTVRDLAARWQTDVLDLNPDWLSVMIGINDVWRQFDCSMATDRHVLLSEFKTVYSGLLEITRPHLKGLVLMTPFVIDAHRKDPMRRQMDAYGKAVRKLAEEFDAVFVDTQAVFDDLMQSIPPTELAWDRIHPGPTGHMALARALLNGLEFSWS